jgi:hypothetical protein
VAPHKHSRAVVVHRRAVVTAAMTPQEELRYVSKTMRHAAVAADGVTCINAAWPDEAWQCCSCTSYACTASSSHSALLSCRNHLHQTVVEHVHVSLLHCMCMEHNMCCNLYRQGTGPVHMSYCHLTCCFACCRKLETDRINLRSEAEAPFRWDCMTVRSPLLSRAQGLPKSTSA